MKIPHDVLAHWASRPVLKVLDIAAILDRDHFWCEILNCPREAIGDRPGAIEDRFHDPQLPPNNPQLPHYGPQLPHIVSLFAPLFFYYLFNAILSSNLGK